MRAIVGKALIAVAAAAMLANPPRKPLKVCGCGTSNEPDRTTCIGCGGSI